MLLLRSRAFIVASCCFTFAFTIFNYAFVAGCPRGGAPVCRGPGPGPRPGPRFWTNFLFLQSTLILGQKRHQIRDQRREKPPSDVTKAFFDVSTPIYFMVELILSFVSNQN